MKYLENLVGKKNFQLIFREYIIKFTNKSVSFKDYIEVFTVNLNKLYNKEMCQEIQSKINWEKWIFSPGEVCENIEYSNFFF